MENCHLEIVDLPIKIKMVIFHSYVKLPDGNCKFSSSCQTRFAGKSQYNLHLVQGFPSQPFLMTPELADSTDLQEGGRQSP